MECILPAVVFIMASMVGKAAVIQRMTHAEIIKKII